MDTTNLLQRHITAGFMKYCSKMKPNLALLKCYVLLNEQILGNKCISGYYALAGQA